jgi:Tol biopolymer transport system component
MNRRDSLGTSGRGIGALMLAGHIDGRRGPSSAARPFPGSGRDLADIRFLASDPRYVYNRPCFTPSGEFVVFQRAVLRGNWARERNSNQTAWSLWVVPVAGGDPSLLFAHDEIRPTRPDCSWTNGHIAFTGIDRNGPRLWLIDSMGQNLTHIPVRDRQGSDIVYPSWCPDGSALAVTDYSTRQVLRVEFPDGAVHELTDPDVVWAGMSSVSPDRGLVQLEQDQGRMPSWSPNGEFLAFASVRRRDVPAFRLHPRTLPGGKTVIYVRRMGGARTHATAVTPFDVLAEHAKWSPDGRRLTCTVYSLQTGERGIAVLELGDLFDQSLTPAG